MWAHSGILCPNRAYTGHGVPQLCGMHVRLSEGSHWSPFLIPEGRGMHWLIPIHPLILRRVGTHRTQQLSKKSFYNLNSFFSPSGPFKAGLGSQQNAKYQFLSKFWLMDLYFTLKYNIYCLGASAEIKVKMVYLTSGYIKSKFEFQNPGFLFLWTCGYLCILSWMTHILRFLFQLLFDCMCTWMQSSQGKQNFPEQRRSIVCLGPDKIMRKPL